MLTAPAAGAGFTRNDTQFWPDLIFTKQVAPGTGVFGFVSAQYSVQAGTFMNDIVSGGVTWGNRHLTVSPYYRYISELTAPHQRQVEHRLAVDITPHTTWRRFGFSDRSRVDLRWLSGVLSERYRNRPQVERSFGERNHVWTPYGAFEIIYDTRFHVWNRHRFFAGVKHQLSPHLALDTYFMRQVDGHAHPGNLYTMGGGLHFAY